MRKPIRAVALVIKEDDILLMWRKKQGKEYYVFPGGGVEENETVREAVLREMKEETTLEIKIEKLLYHHCYINDSDQFFYLCSYIKGEPELGDSNEKEDMLKDKNNVYLPLWVKINKLKDLLLYPLEIRDWLIEDLKNSFKDTPRKASLHVRELRQSL
jgi:ADP-ribose pyrophosphatase YjhB (NUDIX family)